MSTANKVSYTSILGFVLKTARQNAQVTPEEINQKTGIQASGWAKVEKGLVAINAIQIRGFADLVGVSVSEIFAQADQLAVDCESSGKTVVMDERVPTDKKLAAKYLIGGMLAGALTAIILNERHKK